MCSEVEAVSAVARMSVKSKGTPVMRSATSVWLVGNESKHLPGNGKLPTLREVLKVFFYNLHCSPGSMSAADAARITIKELLVVWGKSNIPTQEVRAAIKKLLTAYENYRALGKDKNKTSEKSVFAREEFSKVLDRLFDIGCKDALSKITVEEDKLFYMSMKTDRKGYMAGIDIKWCKRLENRKRLQEKDFLRKKRHEKEKEILDEKVDLVRQMSAESTTSSSDSEEGNFFRVREG